MHIDAKERFDRLRDNVLRLAEVVHEWDEEFELPGDAGEHGAVQREAIDWEAVRGVPKEKHAGE